MADQFLKSELRQTINLFIDNALNKEDEIELIKKIKNNPNIEALLKEEKAFRSKIKDGLSRTMASSTLIDAVRNQIDMT